MIKSSLREASLHLRRVAQLMAPATEPETPELPRGKILVDFKKLIYFFKVQSFLDSSRAVHPSPKANSPCPKRLVIQKDFGSTLQRREDSIREDPEFFSVSFTE